MSRNGVATKGTFFWLVDLDKALQEFNESTPTTSSLRNKDSTTDIVKVLISKADPSKLIPFITDDTKDDKPKHTSEPKQTEKKLKGTDTAGTSAQTTTDVEKQFEDMLREAIYRFV